MRAGVLQLSRWGLLDRVVGRRHPADPDARRSTTATRSRSQISIRPSAGVDALYAPRRTVLDRILVDAADEAGVDVLHGTPGHRAAPGPRRPRGRGAEPHAAAGPRDVPRAVRGGRGRDRLVRGPARSAPRCCGEGRWGSAVQYAYYDGTRRHRLRVGLPRRRRGRPDPDQRRAQLCLRRDLARCGCARCGWSGRPRTRSRRCSGWPRRGTRTGWRPRPGSGGSTAGPGGAGFVRRSWGPGLGPGRRRRALQGPDQHARDHRRAARRGAAGVRRARRPRRDAGPRPRRCDGYQRRRDLLSAQLFEVSDEIAGYDWDSDQVQPLLRRVSAAMIDEVEMLESLPPAADRRRTPSPVRR